MMSSLLESGTYEDSLVAALQLGIVLLFMLSRLGYVVGTEVSPERTLELNDTVWLYTVCLVTSTYITRTEEGYLLVFICSVQ